MPSRVEVENNTIDNYIFIYMLVVVIVDVLWRRKDIGGGDVASDGQRRVSTVCRVRLVSRHEMSQGKHGTKRHNHHWSQSHSHTGQWSQSHWSRSSAQRDLSHGNLLNFHHKWPG